MVDDRGASSGFARVMAVAHLVVVVVAIWRLAVEPDWVFAVLLVPIALFTWYWVTAAVRDGGSP